MISSAKFINRLLGRGRVTSYRRLSAMIAVCVGLVQFHASGVICDGQIVLMEFGRQAMPIGVAHSEHMALLDGRLTYQGPAPVPKTWVRSHAIPIGFPWAIPNDVHVYVTVNSQHVVVDGSESKTDRMTPYFRYSIDRRHWSSWMQLPANTTRHRERGDFFYRLRIPEVARGRWPSLWSRWEATDRSRDLSRFFRWVEMTSPGYFAREIPFVGYVQILTEWPGYWLSELSLTQIRVFLAWGLGGAQGTRLSEDGTPVKDSRQAERQRWRFCLADETVDRRTPVRLPERNPPR